LFVDDDLGENYDLYFRNALDANGYTYDVWDVSPEGSPSASDLVSYRIIIWNTGADYVTTLSSFDQAQLSEYMDNGGNLFLSSEEVLYQLGGTAFTLNYLHVTEHTDDVGSLSAAGIEDDPVSDGMSLELNPVYSYFGRFYFDFSDEIIPDVYSTAIFLNGYGNTSGLRYPAAGPENYRLVFLAFPFEFVSDSAEPNTRNSLMHRIITYLENSSIEVNTNLYYASFTISGTSTFQGAGRSWRVSGISPGTYTITYGDVAWYDTPPPETKTLSNTARITFSGTYTITDSNDNYLPDPWEMHYFGDLSHAALEDSDSDGISNYGEFVSGTDPASPASVFKVINVTRNGDETFDVTWSNALGKAYTIWYKDRPDEYMPWQAVTYRMPVTGVGINTWKDDGTGTYPPPEVISQRYYKIQVVQ
jgi:hypothetical protein